MTSGIIHLFQHKAKNIAQGFKVRLATFKCNARFARCNIFVIFAISLGLLIADHL